MSEQPPQVPTHYRTGRVILITAYLFTLVLVLALAALIVANVGTEQIGVTP